MLVLATAEVYTSALAGFGGVTSPLPSEPSSSSIFSWMKANFSKLPEFVGKVGDFAALSSTTNLAKTLSKAGCEHVGELRHKKEYESPGELGEAPKAISTVVHRFISYFWCKFGQQYARALAEASRGEVCLLALMCFLLVPIFFLF